MRKTLKLAVFVAIFTVMSFMRVNAKSVNVTDQETLKAALQDAEVDTIVLANDIETTEKIDIIRNVTIDGANHTIKYSKDLGETFSHVYVLHYYKTLGTLKNIKLSGAEAALNINGSVVTLSGTIDVSGNRLGGIDLGMGEGVTDFPDIITDNATIVNTTESSTAPTAWFDISLDDIELDDEEDADIDLEAWPFKGVAYIGSKDQIHMFLNRANVPVGDDVIDLSDEFNKDDEVIKEPENVQKKEEANDNVASANPNTYDDIILYLIFTILSLAVLGFTYSKATAR